MTSEFTPRTSPAASVSPTPGSGFVLKIPAGPAGRYRLAQLDDYAALPRAGFPARPPRIMSLRARASAAGVAGTWGFGFWNDPFVLSLGLGGLPIRLPALPNAAWFFYASPESHLTLQDGKPGHGLRAQTFRSPRFHRSLIGAALRLPLGPAGSRRLLGRVVEEETAALPLDLTTWHAFRLAWNADRVSFSVDGNLALETPITPVPPLGSVIWIDNQFAAFRPDGRLGWGTLANDQEASLEVADLQMG